jgi:hypothetical protein
MTVYTSAGQISIPSGTTASTTTTGLTYNYTYTTYGNGTTAYSYFRIIITQTNGTDAFGTALAEWNINFSPATSAITLAPSTTAYGQLNLTGGFAQLGVGTASPQATLDVNGTIGFSYSSVPTLASNMIGYTVSNPLSIQGTTYSAGVNLFDINLGIGVWLIQSYIRTATAQNNTSYMDCNINNINWPIGITTFASGQTGFGPVAVVMNVTAATFVRMTLSLSANTQFNGGWHKATRIA